MRRRQLLTASAIAIAGVAGCSGGTGSENEESAGELGTPENTVRTFYGTLFGDDDIEGANELIHPESEAPELKEADFEPFGGVEAIQADIQSMNRGSESDSRVRIDANIGYSTPAGSGNNIDWFVLRELDGEWLVSLWLPSSERSNMTRDEAEQAIQNA